MLKNEVFDINFKRYGILEKFTYCQYENKYCDCGSFSLKCPATDKNLDLIKEERILWLEDDVAGIIESVNIDTQNDQDEIKISGSLISTILDWRYVYPTYKDTNYPERMMERAVDSNCVSAENKKRNFKFLEIEKIENSICEKITKQQTGDSVQSFLIEVGSANGLGYKVSFDPKNKRFLFKVIQGVDHSVNNKTGSKKIIFSESLNNISTTTYTSDYSSYRNCALVLGEGDGEDRKSAIIFDGEEQDGFGRKELYVDARDVQSEEETDEDGNTVVVTSDEEYAELLLTRGKEKLAECTKVQSLESEVRTDTGTIFQYGIDYNLGDKVTVIKETYGFTADVIVSSVKVTQDKNSYTVTPTFGEAQPTLYSILKKGGVIV